MGLGSNLDSLLAGIKRVAVNGVLLPVGSPSSIVLNLINGLTAVQNATTGFYDVSATSVLFPGVISVVQFVNAGGTIQALAGSLVFVDASGGTCTVIPPALLAGTSQSWGVSDVKAGTWSATNYVNLPNAASVLEDPLSPGVYSHNPVKCTSPNQVSTWMQDPTGTYWKAL